MSGLGLFNEITLHSTNSDKALSQLGSKFQVRDANELILYNSYFNKMLQGYWAK